MLKIDLAIFCFELRGKNRNQGRRNETLEQWGQKLENELPQFRESQSNYKPSQTPFGNSVEGCNYFGSVAAVPSLLCCWFPSSSRPFPNSLCKREKERKKARDCVITVSLSMESGLFWAWSEIFHHCWLIDQRFFTFNSSTLNRLSQNFTGNC